MWCWNGETGASLGTEVRASQGTQPDGRSRAGFVPPDVVFFQSCVQPDRLESSPRDDACMRVRDAIGVGRLALGGAGVVAGQQPPDFSGTWRVDERRHVVVAAAPSPVFGEVFAMRHRGQRVELIRPVRGRETAVVHAFRSTAPNSASCPRPRACLADSGPVDRWLWDGKRSGLHPGREIPPGGARRRSRVASELHLQAGSAGTARRSRRACATRRPGGRGRSRSVYQKSTDVLTEAPRAGRRRAPGDDRGRVVDRRPLGRGHVRRSRPSRNDGHRRPRAARCSRSAARCATARCPRSSFSASRSATRRSSIPRCRMARAAHRLHADEVRCRQRDLREPRAQFSEDDPLREAAGRHRWRL